MQFVTLTLTTKELELLTSLVVDQLFRKEFIDPKMPGYRSNIDDVSLGKLLVARLQGLAIPVAGKAKIDPEVSRTTSRAARAKQAG